MNRTLILLLAVLILGGVAWFALSGREAGSSVSLAENDRQFAYPAMEDVDRIFIADREGHQVNLTRGGVTGWLADGKPANDNVMKNLLAVLRGMDIRTLPTRKAIPNMIDNLSAQGIRVQLYGKSGQELRDYYIGGPTSDEKGVFAIMDGSENPYVVHLPNFTGNIRTRFNHWGDEWRDRIYFRVDPDKVTSFSIDYPRQQDKSFRLERSGDGFLLSPLYDTGQQPRQVSRGQAERALAKYEKYYVNRYENRDTETIAEARNFQPFATISITQEGEAPKVMEIFPRYQHKTFSNDAKSGESIVNGGLDAFTAFINDREDWVLLNVETTQPLLVSYDSF